MATVRETSTGKGVEGSADGTHKLLCCGVCSYCAQGKISKASLQLPKKARTRTNPQLEVSSLQKMAEYTFVVDVVVLLGGGVVVVF